MHGFHIIKIAKAFLRVFIIRNSFERRECFASPYANGSHASMRRSCTARCEGLAPLGAKVLHCSVRRSCTARCECLAPPYANVSHASMREVRNPCFFLSFYFAPYIEKSHFFCYPSKHSTKK